MTTAVSQAVQTAKKLKKLISEPGEASSNRKKSDFDTKLSPKRSKKSTPFDAGAVTEDIEESASELTNHSNVSSSSGCNDHASSNTIDERIDSPESEDDGDEIDPLSSWSREEDKILLERIKMGFSSEEDLVRTIQTEQLPTRNLAEIHNRITFLMDIIANL